MIGEKGLSAETWKKIPYLPELVETHIPKLIEQAGDYVSQYLPEPTVDTPANQLPTNPPQKQLASDSIKSPNSTPVPTLKSPTPTTINDGWEKTRVFKDQADDDDEGVF